MSTPMIIKKEVHFAANPAQVWDLLTNPAMTKQYMFGCEVLSDWQVGRDIQWKGLTEDGASIIYVKGKIVEIEAGKMVTFTMFDPNLGLADIPENYVNLTYDLSATDSGTLLVLTQGDYVGAENAQQRYEESIKGWDMVIPLMQGLLA